MIRRYALVSGRIRQELRNLERVVNRIEDGMAAARKRPEDQDFYLDSIALNLHDFYLICWPLLALWNVWLPTRNDCVPDCSRPHDPI